jgi:hypothetical protein
VLANISETQSGIEIEAAGGPEMLGPAARSVPEPRAGEGLIRIDADGKLRPAVLAVSKTVLTAISRRTRPMLSGRETTCAPLPG